MSVEIEKKYRLTAEQAQYVEDELADVAANFVGEDLEENTIYGGGVLDEKLAVLRIRTTERKSTMTYKRRIQNASDAKHQIEYETEISDPDSVAALFSELNFSPRLVYEKRRKTWKLRNTEIVLDELPFGRYMEIEGSITEIKEAEMILGIEDFEVENETYPRLTSRLGTNKNGVIEARFEK
jgi:adenylate cyclase, class 2